MKEHGRSEQHKTLYILVPYSQCTFVPPHFKSSHKRAICITSGTTRRWPWCQGKLCANCINWRTKYTYFPGETKYARPRGDGGTEGRLVGRAW